MAFLWNHQMFLKVFSKKVRFCCILGCFAEKKLPQMSQILTDGACLECCEFCVLWEYSSPTDCTDQHRWLVALVVAWVWQDAIPSYICVNPCYLWETLLYKKVLCRFVKSVGGNHSEKVLWSLWILWEEISLVGAVLALASGKAERRQLHPLRVSCVGGVSKLPYSKKITKPWLSQARALLCLKVVVPLDHRKI